MIRNLFEAVGAPRAELVDLLLQAGRVRIERIVSCGQSSPAGFWYDQREAEWVLVLQGAGTVRFEADDRVVSLQAGDHLLIPAHARDRVDWTPPEQITIWLAVFFPDAEQESATANPRSNI